jgi:single-strand DNA-binding protein
MSVKKVIVIGNRGASPNIRALPSGQNVANFSLATTERFTDRNGAKQEHTDWPSQRGGTAKAVLPSTI